MLTRPVVEAAVFHSDGHYQASEEHVVGRVEIIDGDLPCNDDKSSKI